MVRRERIESLKLLVDRSVSSLLPDPSDQKRGFVPMVFSDWSCCQRRDHGKYGTDLFHLVPRWYSAHHFICYYRRKSPALKRKIINLVLLWSLSAAAIAHSKTVEELTSAAKSGDVAAQNSLGDYYDRGITVPSNPEQAAFWTLKAAKAGNIYAQERMASMYMRGFGVSKDADEALRWTVLAADQGSVIGNINASLIYLKGIGVPQSIEKGLPYLLRAVEARHPQSMSNLAALYFNGTGVPRDYAKAAKLILAAAEMGNVGAMKSAGDFLSHGVGVMPNRSAALEWYKKAANAGDEDAKRIISSMSQNGKPASSAAGTVPARVPSM
jgi:TPR repeat protein